MFLIMIFIKKTFISTLWQAMIFLLPPWLLCNLLILLLAGIISSRFLPEVSLSYFQQVSVFWWSYRVPSSSQLRASASLSLSSGSCPPMDEAGGGHAWLSALLVFHQPRAGHDGALSADARPLLLSHTKLMEFPLPYSFPLPIPRGGSH